uniref:Uncharacterized protein n=1 Tax=Anguilla anguilla TaxID=7936 RepID=A0A0E9XQ65_ANGAN
MCSIRLMVMHNHRYMSAVVTMQQPSTVHRHGKSLRMASEEQLDLIFFHPLLASSVLFIGSESEQ